MSTQSIIQIISQYFVTQPVTKAWLFGSYSRGEQREDSDVDILVSYDKDAKISLMTISRIAFGLQEVLGRKVDLVEEGHLKPFAIDSVNHDKKLIYERKS